MNALTKTWKALASFLLSIALTVSFGWFYSVNVSANSGATGVGLAEHAMTAYNEHWRYSYGGSSNGTVDCSGLIATYYGVGGSRCDMLDSSPVSGSIGSLPNIHGLGLYQPGHVGVYVGSGMAVDARNESSGVVYQSVYSHAWTYWFKVAGVQYPDNGWESFNGNTFYYQNGQYVTDTTLTIDGTSYYFDQSGALDGNAPANAPVSYKTAEQAPSVSNQKTVVPSQETVSNQAQPKSTALKVGVQCAEVLSMKTRMQELGYYPAELTDYFGEFTAERVKEFQKEAGLDETGEANQATLDALYAENAPKAPVTYEIGSTDAEVAVIKTRLAQLSYFYGEGTDYYGEDTAMAVSDFQAAAGLDVTGKADNATRDCLYADNAAVNPEAGTLKYGVVGEAVTQLQNRLISLRYMNGTAGNEFNDDTVAAVKKYQAVVGDEQTGKLSKQALEVLYAANAVKASDYYNLKIGYVGQDVADLQTKLNELGYFAGQVSGIFDETTDIAFRAFQAENGLKLTGVATVENINTIDELLAQKEENQSAGAMVEDMSVHIVSSPLAKSSNEAALAANLLDSTGSKSGNDILWILLISTVLLTGTVCVFLLQRYSYTYKSVKRKHKIKKNARVRENLEQVSTNMIS